MPAIKMKLPDGRTMRMSTPAGDATRIPEFRQIMAEDAAVMGANQAAKETGPLQAFGVGAADTAINMARGVQDIVTPAAHAALHEKPKHNPVGALRRERPMATAAGDIATLMATGGAGRLPTQLAASTAQAIALNPENPALGAAEGVGFGGLGLLGAKVLGRLISPQATNNFTSARTLDLADQLGIKLTAGWRSGSKTARKKESELRSNPRASRSFDELDAENMATLNRRALESIGEQGDEISDEVLNNARKRIGSVFDDLGRDVQKVDANNGDFINRIAAIEEDAINSLDEAQFKLFNKQLNDVLDTVSGDIDGRALINLRSKLGKTIDSLYKNNGAAGDSVSNLQAAVEDLIFDSSPEGTRQAFAQAKTQWSNLRMLRKRNVVIDGDLQPARLRSVVQSEQEHAFRLGNQENNRLFQIARLQEGIKEIVGDSGTATRESKGLVERGLGHTIDAASAAMRTNPVTSRVLANQITREGRAVPKIMASFGRATGVEGSKIDSAKIANSLLKNGAVIQR